MQKKKGFEQVQARSFMIMTERNTVKKKRLASLERAFNAVKAKPIPSRRKDWLLDHIAGIAEAVQHGEGL